MFLLTYLVLVFTFGLSLLLVEIALGRKTRQSTIGAFKLFGKKYAFIGILASLVPFIITPYYCVIGGWVAKYVGAYFFDPATMIGDGGTYFSSFITSSLSRISGSSSSWLSYSSLYRVASRAASRRLT